MQVCRHARRGAGKEAPTSRPRTDATDATAEACMPLSATRPGRTQTKPRLPPYQAHTKLVLGRQRATGGRRQVAGGKQAKLVRSMSGLVLPSLSSSRSSTIMPPTLWGDSRLSRLSMSRTRPSSILSVLLARFPPDIQLLLSLSIIVPAQTNVRPVQSSPVLDPWARPQCTLHTALDTNLIPFPPPSSGIVTNRPSGLRTRWPRPTSSSCLSRCAFIAERSIPKPHMNPMPVVDVVDVLDVLDADGQAALATKSASSAWPAATSMPMPMPTLAQASSPSTKRRRTAPVLTDCCRTCRLRKV